MIVSDPHPSPLAERLGFYRINPKDADFPAIAKALDKFGDKSLDAFYENVAATPETAKFFSGKAGMDRAHKAQAKHWRKLFTLGIDDNYNAASKAVGDVHARIGLEPKWYIGGYANILAHVITGILTDGIRGLSRRRRNEARMIATFVKVALMDMDLAITRYFELDEERRSTVITAVVVPGNFCISQDSFSANQPTTPATLPNTLVRSRAGKG